MEANVKQILTLVAQYQMKFSGKINSNEALARASSLANPNRSISYKRRDTGYLAFSITNVREEYLKKLTMTSLSGFLYRMLDEHDFDYDYKDFHLIDESNGTYDPETTKLTSTDPNNVENRVNLEDKRKIIENFLDHYFKYNPDIHVRSAHVPTITNVDRETGEMIGDLTRNVEIDTSEYPLPSGDIFSRWNRYEENHYEQIRKITNDIYAYKPDIEYIIQPYDIFSSKARAEEFKDKYENELANTIRLVQVGAPSFLASWEPNRESINHSNKNTRILDAMLEQSKKDTKTYTDMVGKRKEVQKKKEILKQGYDDPGLYKNAPSASKNKDSVGDQTAVRGKDIEPRPKEERPIVHSATKGNKIRKANLQIEHPNQTNLICDSNSDAQEQKWVEHKGTKYSMDPKGKGYDRNGDEKITWDDIPDDQGAGDEDEIPIQVIHFKNDPKTKQMTVEKKQFMTEAEGPGSKEEIRGMKQPAQGPGSGVAK